MIKPAQHPKQREMAVWHIRHLAYDEYPYADMDNKMPYCIKIKQALG